MVEMKVEKMAEKMVVPTGAKTVVSRVEQMGERKVVGMDE